MRIINKLFIALVMLVVFGSCEKKLTDLDPIDDIPSEEAIQTMPDVTNALNGVYGTWQARRSVYVNSTISDEIRLGTGGEYRNIGNILFNWNHVSDSEDWRNASTGGVWTNLYSVIDRANRLLELMQNVPVANTTEEALKAQYRGELLALRAMAHLELLRFYSETAEYTPDKLGIVVQTEYVKTPGSYRPARSTQQAAITQINADLAEARNLVPASFANISRITRNAVIAIQARTAQHTKNWQGVVDRATEVIAAQPLTPRASYAALWTTRTLAENQSTEVIWKLNVSPANLAFAVGSLFQDVGTGAVQASPSEELLNSYDQVNDIRFSTFFRTTPRNLIAKYGAVVGSNNENFQYDIKMIRTSELVLARAEAYAELNQLPLANNDLSMLRSARITGYVHTTINDKATLINEILQERFKELAYEGQRYHDLRRRSLPITRTLGDAGGNAEKQTLAANNFRYILPIPQQEAFANPSIQQNPQY